MIFCGNSAVKIVIFYGQTIFFNKRTVFHDCVNVVVAMKTVIFDDIHDSNYIFCRP